MVEEKAQRTTDEQRERNSGDVFGRVHNSQNPAVEQGGSRNDISSIDQQEGNMNHGECGGNMNKESEAK